MKVIRTIETTLIEAIDGPTEEITKTLADSIMKPAQENKLRVLGASQDIELLLGAIIAQYFFGNDPANRDRQRKFAELVLASDWFLFASKRRLVTHIINETGVLKGAEKEEFDTIIGKVMRFRNAFAHGTISTDGRKVKLAYFEGGPQARILEDTYLGEVEKALNDGFGITHKVLGAIRAL